MVIERIERDGIAEVDGLDEGKRPVEPTKFIYIPYIFIHILIFLGSGKSSLRGSKLPYPFDLMFCFLLYFLIEQKAVRFLGNRILHDLIENQLFLFLECFV